MSGNKQQIRYGMAQLSGTAAYMTAAKLALPALIAAGFGISKKENPEKDNKNASQLAPSYYEGNDLQVVCRDKACLGTPVLDSTLKIILDVSPGVLKVGNHIANERR